MERVAVAVPPASGDSPAGGPPAPGLISARAAALGCPRLPPVPVVLRVSFFAITCSVAKDFCHLHQLPINILTSRALSRSQHVIGTPNSLIRAHFGSASNRGRTYIRRGKNPITSERPRTRSPLPLQTREPPSRAHAVPRQCVASVDRLTYDACDCSIVVLRAMSTLCARILS